jgi:hypothetical protein
MRKSTASRKKGNARSATVGLLVSALIFFLGYRLMVKGASTQGVRR